MAMCQQCDDESTDLTNFGKGRDRRKLCEDCFDDAQREAEIAAEAEDVMGGMMEYKGG